MFSAYLSIFLLAASCNSQSTCAFMKQLNYLSLKHVPAEPVEGWLRLVASDFLPNNDDFACRERNEILCSPKEEYLLHEITGNGDGETVYS